MKHTDTRRDGVSGALSRSLLRSAMILSIWISVFACSAEKITDKPGDKDTTQTPPVIPSPDTTPNTPKAPIITDLGAMTGDTSITSEASIAFRLKVETPDTSEFICAWYLDNDSVAGTTDYTFGPKGDGTYSLKFKTWNAGGSDSMQISISVYTPARGFYIVNEGQYGTTMGSVNYFNLRTMTLTNTVYQTANPGKELGMTTCYGAQWNNRMYFVSKQGNRLVAAEAGSLKHIGALETIGGDGRAFAGVNATTGVVTTNQGAYVMNLSDINQAGIAIKGTEGVQCGAVRAHKGYVFIIKQNAGIMVFDPTKNYELVKQHAKGSVGFTTTPDGNLWAAEGSTLIRINASTLEFEEIAMPDGVRLYDSWGAWNNGSLCASPTENVIYFTKSGTWGGGREIYRYKVGDISSLSKPFISSSKTDDAFYGSGIGVDAVTGDIIATFVRKGWGESYSDNRLVIFDHETGAEKHRSTYSGYWFPTMILSNSQLRSL